MEEPQKPKKSWISYWIIALCVFLLLQAFVFPNLFKGRVKEVGYETFISMTENNEIGSVTIESNQITFTDKSEKQVYQTGRLDDPDLIQRLYNSGAKFESQIDSGTSPLLYILISYVLPIALMLLVFHFFNKKMAQRMGGGDGSMMFGMGKSNAKVYVKSTTGIKFKDVAGEEEAKELLAEIVDYLHKPERYKEIGASMPKGALLVGPPGTGKTLLAKAVAGEANVPFFSISGSEFVEMFVGRGAAKVRELFEQANKQAPCIVFIDEIDTIGKKRGAQLTTNDEREQTLNQLLTEMDGFKGNQGVIILAATNRPEVLDPALLRPGRFDRQVRVELPDLKGREAILNVHLKKIKTEETIDVNYIARMTAGASGAQLANIVNEAALRAVRMGKDSVTTADLAESVETIIAGAEKKNSILSEEEKRIVAYHEIGHALVAAKQSGSAPVQKITIVPRTSGALGYTMQVEEDEKSLISKKDACQKLEVLCGGRAAEEVVFDIVTTGASNDIERATDIARNMVTRYGMSENFGMMALQTGGNTYLGDPAQSTCSPETARLVDEEIQEIIAAAHRRAKEILMENREKMDELAAYLLEKETISGEEFMEILEGKTA